MHLSVFEAIINNKISNLNADCQKDNNEGIIAFMDSSKNHDLKNMDAIVVGAGPAGISAAVEIARGGKSVVVLERAQKFGSKNMFGGAIYIDSIKKLFPNSYQEAPIERYLTSHTYSLLAENTSVEINYKNSSNKDAATVFRPKFDFWMVENAKKEGVFFAPSTVARKLIYKEGAVAGVKTDLEEFYAPVVVVADGVNSLLAKQIGLRFDMDPKHVILSIKETLKLDKTTIEDRFNLKSGSKEGAVKEYIGGFKGVCPVKKSIFGKKTPDMPFAIGYIYTFKDYISVGLGVSLEDLINYKLKPYELLDKLKSHKNIDALIQGAEVSEYSAHLIPEGGYNNLPKLYANGVMIVGDAAGLVNGVHFEGTNFAVESGKLAAETALIALKNNDFSANTLSLYEKKLKESFVIKDLKSYRNVLQTVQKRAKSLFDFYPNQASEFFEAFTSVDGKTKKEKFRKFIKNFIMNRSFIELMRDFKAIVKTFFEVIF